MHELVIIETGHIDTRFKHEVKNNILLEIYLRKTDSERMEWLQVAEVQGPVAGLMNTIMNPWAP